MGVARKTIATKANRWGADNILGTEKQYFMT